MLENPAFPPSVPGNSILKEISVTAAAASTAAVLASFPVRKGMTVLADAFVQGYDATADEVSLHRAQGVARNTAGTTALIDADVNQLAVTEGSDDSALAIVIDDTTDTIRVQATGNSTNGNNFRGHVRFTEMASAVQ